MDETNNNDFYQQIQVLRYFVFYTENKFLRLNTVWIFNNAKTDFKTFYRYQEIVMPYGTRGIVGRSLSPVGVLYQTETEKNDTGLSSPNAKALKQKNHDDGN